MADNALDGIVLELEATTDKAEKGLDEAVKYLRGLKNAVNQVDTGKLKSVCDSLNGIAGLGDQLKNAGAGMRDLSSSLKVLSKIDSGKFNEISNSVQSVADSMRGMSGIKGPSIDSGNIGGAASSIKDAANEIRESFEKTPSFDMSGIAAGANAARDSFRAAGEEVNDLEDSIRELSEKEKEVATNAEKAAGAQQKFNESFKDDNSKKIQELIDKINEYKKTISGMENGNINFDAEKYREAVNGLNEAKAEFQSFKDSLNDGVSSANNFAGSLSGVGSVLQKIGFSNLGSAVKNFSSVLSDISKVSRNAGKGLGEMKAASSGAGSAIGAVAIGVVAAVAALKLLDKTATKALNGLKTGLSNVVKAVKPFGKAIKSAFEAAIGKLREMAKEVKTAFGITDGVFESLKRKLQSVSRLFTFMMLRKAITHMITLARDGFNNLIMYSDMFGTQFHKSINSIYSDIVWIGNSLTTIVEPIVNALAPLFDFLAEKINLVCSLLAQFFALLTGKSTYTKAVKQNLNYAGSLQKVSKAAKELKDFTIGIDELNILNDKEDDNGGGAGGLGDIGSMFEPAEVSDSMKDLWEMIKEAWENADFYDIGRMIGEKIISALMSIPWDTIRENARKVGKSLATLLNGILESEVDGTTFGTAIGYTIAQGINTIFEVIDAFAWNFHFDSLANAIMDAVQGICDNLDWSLIHNAVQGMASGLADFINGIFARTETFKSIGETIGKAVNEGIGFFHTFVNRTNFDQIGVSLGTMVREAIEKIHLGDLGTALGKAISGAFSTIGSFSLTLSDSHIGTKIADAINKFLDNIRWQDRITIGPGGEKQLKTGIKTAFEATFKNLGAWITEFFKELDPKKVGNAISEGIKTLISGFSSFVDELDFKEIGDAIVEALNTAIEGLSGEGKEFGESLGKLASGICDILKRVIREVDWPALEKEFSDALSQIDFGEIFATFIQTKIKLWFAKKKLKWDFIGEALFDMNDGYTGEAYDPTTDPSWEFYQSLPGKFQEIGAAISGAFETAWNAVVTSVTVAWDAIKSAFETAWNAITTSVTTAWNTIKSTFTNAWKTIVTGVSNAWSSIKQWFETSWTSITNGVTSTWNTITSLFARAWNAIVTGVTNAWNTIKQEFTAALNNIRNNVTTAWNTIKSIFSNAWSAITTGVKTAWNTIKQEFTAALANIKSSVTTAWETIKSTFTNALNAIISKVSTTWSSIKQAFTEGVSKIVSAITDIDWVKLGSNIIDGIWNGIKSGWDWLIGKVKELAGNLLGAAKEALGIASPSKRFAEIGEYSVLGFGNGISSVASTCDQKITEWTSNIKEWFTGGDGSINAATWGEYAKGVVDGFKNKVGNYYTTVKSNVDTWTTNLKNWFKNDGQGAINSNTWDGYARNIIDGFKTKVGNYYTAVKSNVDTWTSNLKTWFSGQSGGNINATQWSTYAQNVVDGFKNKIGSYYSTAKTNMTAFATNVKSYFTSVSGESAWEQIASDVVNGFKNKVGSLYSTCKDTITSWGSDIISWFKEKLGINSPSRVFAQLGAFTIQGFNAGVDKEGDSTQATMKRWTKSISDIAVDIGTKVRIDDSSLKKVKANYGADFENSTLVRTTQNELLSEKSIQATLNAGGGLKNAMKEALVESGVVRHMEDTAEATRKQADKQEKTIVQIGRREINNAIIEQKSADGFSFQPA